jgi:hypothetical protein
MKSEINKTRFAKALKFKFKSIDIPGKLNIAAYHYSLSGGNAISGLSIKIIGARLTSLLNIRVSLKNPSLKLAKKID